MRRRQFDSLAKEFTWALTMMYPLPCASVSNIYGHYFNFSYPGTLEYHQLKIIKYNESPLIMRVSWNFEFNDYEQKGLSSLGIKPGSPVGKLYTRGSFNTEITFSPKELRPFAEWLVTVIPTCMDKFTPFDYPNEYDKNKEDFRLRPYTWTKQACEDYEPVLKNSFWKVNNGGSNV